MDKKQALERLDALEQEAKKLRAQLALSACRGFSNEELADANFRRDSIDAQNEIDALRAQLAEAQAEIERLRKLQRESFDLEMDSLARSRDELGQQLAASCLAESIHDQQANEYARKVAYWIEKHDALRAQLAEAQAEIERIREQLNKHWKLQREDVVSGDIGSFL